MNRTKELDALLSHWQKQGEAGSEVSPEELCRQHPDLLPAVIQGIQALRMGLQLLDTQAGESTTDANRTTQARDTASQLLSIPGYVITCELARGGMGRVLAGVELNLDREVAIKVLLPSADARRFVTESKITARLPHPSIPPVYALGSLADGSPFLAMKLVRGKTLADELKARPEPLHELPRSLQIFEQIAQAVGFAHSQGIIHRDLKPANVMVGAFGEVQVMDWGLAKEISGGNPSASHKRDGQKSVDESPADLTLENSESPNQYGAPTQSGAILGTPNYMAPEQARGDVVDARADVFALGGILCSILTGNAVFGGNSVLETVRQAAAGDTSSALARLDVCGAEAEVIHLAKHCLETNPANRPTDGQAVAKLVAEYRLSVEERLKQAETAKAEAIVHEAEQRKRWRAMQWAASIIAVVLLVGILGTSIGLLQAKEAKEAERLAKDDANRKRQEAEANLEYAKKGNKILSSVFEGLRPEEIAKSGSSLQDVLKDNLKVAVNELDGAAIGDPLVVAEMQDTLGYSLYTMGDEELAIKILEKVRATRLHLLGPEHPKTLHTINNLALAYQNTGKLDLALPFFEELVKIRKAKFGPEHLDTLGSMCNLARAYQDAKELDLALPLLEETLKLMKSKLGPEHPNTLISMGNLAVAYRDSGKLDLALPLLEETLKLTIAHLGREHPNTFASMASLALAYKDAGKVDLALPLLEETLKLTIAHLGREHPNTIRSMINLAGAYRDSGKLDLALPLLEETLRIRKSRLGPEHPNTISSMNNLAGTYWFAKQFNKSIPLFEETLKSEEAKLGRNHPDTLITLANLGVNYKDAGRFKEAIPLLEEAHQASKKHSSLIWVSRPLLDAYAKTGEMAKLKALLPQARQSLPKDSQQLAGLLAHVGMNLLEQKLWVEAELLLRESLAIFEKILPEVWSTFNTQSMLGGAMLGQKKYVEAEPLLLKGYEGMKLREKTITPQGKVNFSEALNRLIQLYTETKKPEEVKKWQAERAKYPEASKKALPTADKK